MMAFFIALFSAIAAAPRIFESVGKLIDLVNEAYRQIQREKFQKTFEDETQKTQKSKDTGALEHLFDPGEK